MNCKFQAIWFCTAFIFSEPMQYFAVYFALYSMINIISATNREGSATEMVSRVYNKIAQTHSIPTQLFTLTNLPEIPLGDFIYRKGENPWRSYSEQLFNSNNRIVIVAPEYNGSIPGILKLIIDCCDPQIFAGKKFALLGVASGRAGNLRGMDDLSNMLHYLKATVYWNKLPISQIRQLVDENRVLNHPDTLVSMEKHLLGFVSF